MTSFGKNATDKRNGMSVFLGIRTYFRNSKSSTCVYPGRLSVSGQENRKHSCYFNKENETQHDRNTGGFEKAKRETELTQK